MKREPFAWEASYPQNLSWSARIDRFPVFDLLETAAASCPDQTALRFNGWSLSFADWKQQAERLAAALIREGLAPGATVAMLMPNTPHFPICFFALMRAGMRAVLLSPLDSPRTIQHKMSDSGARTLITINVETLFSGALGARSAGLVDRVIVGDHRRFGPDDLPCIDIAADEEGVIELEELCEGATIPQAWPRVETGDIALLQYTGGTTGLPKGAILTHGNLSAANSIYNVWFDAMQTDADQAERVLCVLPLFHIYALSAVMLLCVRRHAEIVLHTRFDASKALEDIERLRITSFPGVPTMWIAMAGHPDFARRDLSSMKRCSSGGAPLPVEVGRRCEETTGQRLVGGWGMSETAAAGTGLLPFGEPRHGSIGMPLPGIELGIVSVEDPEEELPPGEIGEVRVKGLNITGGYWNRPEATNGAIRNGYLLTGDVGYMAPDGHFYIVDRKGDMIISGGFNVYPQLVEQAIYEHPDVSECTVVGVPDAYRGESAKAFVVLRAGAAEFSLETLLGFLDGKLGRHEMPRHLEFREALPRTPVGKLSRKELRDEERARAASRDTD